MYLRKRELRSPQDAQSTLQPYGSISGINLLFIFLVILLFSQCTHPNQRYIDINGSDSSGNGSSSKPWRTLKHGLSKVPANQGYTLRLSEGIFVEEAYLRIPPGVNIIGAGHGLTVIKAAPQLHSPSNQWQFDKFLFILASKSNVSGDQQLGGFSIDGDLKHLYGGILVKGRSHVTVQDIHIQDTYYTAIWFWETVGCRIVNVAIKDCSWASPEGSSAAVLITASNALEIGYVDVNESIGYGIKALGDGKIDQLKIHDSHISVHPNTKKQTSNGDFTPNLAIEFNNVELTNCEIYNNNFENGFSVIMDKEAWARPTTKPTIRIYNNTFDLLTRAKGHSLGLQLNVHNVEVDHNYFHGGTTAIVNWGGTNSNTRHNWKVHHNIFYGLESYYPSAVIALFRTGIENAHIYNNTIELNGTATINFIEVNNGGIANGLKIKNNLVINSNKEYKWYPNKIISLENNATMKNSVVSNNFFEAISMETMAGVSNRGNYIGIANINKKGSRPRPYYELTPGSSLIDAGENVGFKYSGSAPDIGALEQ